MRTLGNTQDELLVEIPLLVMSRAGLRHSVWLQSHTPEPHSFPLDAQNPAMGREAQSQAGAGERTSAGRADSGLSPD